MKKYNTYKGYEVGRITEGHELVPRVLPLKVRKVLDILRKSSCVIAETDDGPDGFEAFGILLDIAKNIGLYCELDKSGHTMYLMDSPKTVSVS